MSLFHMSLTGDTNHDRLRLISMTLLTFSFMFFFLPVSAQQRDAPFDASVAARQIPVSSVVETTEGSAASSAVPADASLMPVPSVVAANPTPLAEAVVSPGLEEKTGTAQVPDGSVPRSDLPHDLSPWGMFMAADIVVKAVMIGLALASLATWTICLAKALEMVFARRRIRRALDVIGAARTLEDAVIGLGKGDGPVALMSRAVAEEVVLSGNALDYVDGKGLKERVSSVLARIEMHAGRGMAHGTGFLATTGSTAPFIGLFGTVWGIMNSFIGISKAQTTNLAVVAPGIAEALLATAIGLIVAIPAVVIYNAFVRSISGYRRLLGDAASGLERLVSRDLDGRKVIFVQEKKASLVRPRHAVSE